MRKYQVRLGVLYVVRVCILFRIQWMHSEDDFALSFLKRSCANIK